MTYEELCAIDAASVLAWYWRHSSVAVEECASVDEALNRLEEIDDYGDGATIGIEVFDADGTSTMIARTPGDRRHFTGGPEWNAIHRDWRAGKAEEAARRKAERPPPEPRSIWFVTIRTPDIGNKRLTGENVDAEHQYYTEAEAVASAAKYGSRAKVTEFVLNA